MAFGGTPAFGGGFGAKPATAFGGSAFGAATPGFGGAAASPFGATPTASAFGGGATGGAFGKPANTGFGATPATGGFGAAPSTSAFGATGGFGAAPATGGFGTPAAGGFGAAPATGGFGTGSAFGTTPAATRSPFGAAPTNTGAFGSTATPSAFGASTPGFGSPAATSQFGVTQTNASPFGASSAFGATAGATTGSGNPKWQVTREHCPSSRKQLNKQSICLMPAYQNKSAIELRWEDYKAGNKGVGTSTGATGGFGAPAAPAAGGFSFGASPTPAAGGFGAAPATGGFGAAPAAGGFGAPAAGGFGAAPAAGGFGAKPAAGGFSFGATPATPAPAAGGFSFGASPTPAAGGFGAKPAAPAAGGFSFGATPAKPAAAAGGFSFGATPAKPAAAGFGSGFAAATGTTTGAFGASPGGFNFAVKPSPAGATTTPAASGGFSFGGASATKPATAAGGFNFGATPAKPAGGTGAFGLNNTSTGGFQSAGGAFGFGGLSNTGTGGSAGGGSFNFSGANKPAAGGGATGAGQFNFSGGGGAKPAASPFAVAGSSGTSSFGGLSGGGLGGGMAGMGGGGMLGAANPMNVAVVPAFETSTFRKIHYHAMDKANADGFIDSSGADVNRNAPRYHGASHSHALIKPREPTYSLGLNLFGSAVRGSGPTPQMQQVRAQLHGGSLFDTEQVISPDTFVMRSTKKLEIRPRISSPAVNLNQYKNNENSRLKDKQSKNDNNGQNSKNHVNIENNENDNVQNNLVISPSPKKVSLNASGSYDDTNYANAIRSAASDEYSKVESSCNTPPFGLCDDPGTNYYTVPALHILQQMEPSKLANIKNFEVGNDNVGSVTWNSSEFSPNNESYANTDVRGIDLSVIKIGIDKNGYGFVSVYDDDDKKPDVGKKLNKPAQITLQRIYPPVGCSAKKMIKWSEKIRRNTKKMGARFISYHPERGEWKFEVLHFSRYGFDSESDGEDTQDIDAHDKPQWFPKEGELILWRDAEHGLQKVIVHKSHLRRGSEIPIPSEHFFTVQLDNLAAIRVPLTELQPIPHGFHLSVPRDSMKTAVDNDDIDHTSKRQKQSITRSKFSSSGLDNSCSESEASSDDDGSISEASTINGKLQFAASPVSKSDDFGGSINDDNLRTSNLIGDPRNLTSRMNTMSPTIAPMSTQSSPKIHPHLAEQAGLDAKSVARQHFFLFGAGMNNHEVPGSTQNSQMPSEENNQTSSMSMVMYDQTKANEYERQNNVEGIRNIDPQNVSIFATSYSPAPKPFQNRQNTSDVGTVDSTKISLPSPMLFPPNETNVHVTSGTGLTVGGGPCRGGRWPLHRVFEQEQVDHELNNVRRPFYMGRSSRVSFAADGRIAYSGYLNGIKNEAFHGTPCTELDSSPAVVTLQRLFVVREVGKTTVGVQGTPLEISGALLRLSLELSNVDMIDDAGNVLNADEITSATGYDDDLVDAPLARPQTGRAAVSLVHRYIESISQFESSSKNNIVLDNSDGNHVDHDSKISSSQVDHTRRVFELVNSLWGWEVDPLVNRDASNDVLPVANSSRENVDALWVPTPHARFGEETDTPYMEDFDDVYAQRQMRREALRFWLSNVVRQEQNISENTGEAGKGSLFQLLVAGRVEEAYEHASADGNLRLASLIAQSGGGEEFRLLVAEQLDEWRKQKAHNLIALRHRDLWLTYALLAGDEAEVLRHVSADSMSWKQSFSTLLNNILPANATVATVVRAYIERNNLKSRTVPVPRPWYIEKWPMRYPVNTETIDEGNFDDGYSSFEVRNSSGYDAYRDNIWCLLRLFCDRSDARAFLGALDCRSSTDDVQDAQMSWFLLQALVALGCVPTCSENDISDYSVRSISARLNRDFSAQLQAYGMWIWAIYIVLHLPDPEHREAAARDIMCRHCPPLTTDPPFVDPEFQKRTEFLQRKLHVPTEWVHAAMAQRAAYEGNIAAQLTYLTSSKQWVEAHEVVMTDVAPHTMLNNDEDTTKSLETILSAIEQHKFEVPTWEHRGGMILRYVQLQRMIKTSTSGTIEPSEIESRLEDVRQRLGNVSGTHYGTLKEKIFLTEIATDLTKKLYLLRKSQTNQKQNNNNENNQSLRNRPATMDLLQDWAATAGPYSNRIRGRCGGLVPSGNNISTKYNLGSGVDNGSDTNVSPEWDLYPEEKLKLLRNLSSDFMVWCS